MLPPDFRSHFKPDSRVILNKPRKFKLGKNHSPLLRGDLKPTAIPGSPFLAPKLPLGSQNQKGDPAGRPYVFSSHSQVQLGNELRSAL